MSNNFLIDKNINKQIVSNIFSSLITSEKWDMLIEIFRLKILDINARDCNGRNALYWAILKNKTDIIKKLIDLDISTEVSPNFLAMNLAVYNDNIKVIKCLKNCGLNINVIDDINSTPLIYAILYNKQNSIKYLIENGANLDHEDFLGNSPLNLLNNLNK
ncbi:ankyrin repeat domain-containing protein [Aliarcobacter butzleri]|uniref:ankyrin repeat domain-containing protein n=1 Tax=Aliarcobacter butzleri TaxID=28197 RepID=UPI001EDC04CE|nr:ankyrin repeat domain-containing protein [Aliarcobacter butzleri]MCP3650058.1 ankyrin repeat domain-containing protein [Arcobacter sp. DNRA7]MCG3672288.1 ankyrin repeat domain-containing protein [Aliarcobacter butzleri]MCG3690421.1 ankyrin repeat domain-containing protein [Aliarcobacter butzleri]MCR1816231.1 ankyrin repeat domain-containing protein [Aliarcobacter butzleri]MDN5100422.1 ankyrin repeat domain-containing protein [Aliarcobacter butzleri]